MRAIWKGAISFGLVTIPVALYSATEDKSPKFKQLRKSDASPIRYRRVAEADGNEVTWDEIVRGFEVEKGSYVVISDEELASATSGGGARLVDVIQFADESEIDPLYYRSSYFLAPEKTGAKAYRILLDALAERGRVGIAKVSIRDKESLATLRARGNVLVLETMHWPDEVREAAFEELDVEVQVRPEEVEMAAQLIENMTRPFETANYQDARREQVEELVAKKLEGHEIMVPESPQPTKVIDLLEALKASVEAAKLQRQAS